jgi:hypothetical protein
MVAGPGSTPRARVANTSPSSSSTHRTTAATATTSNGVVNWGEGERPVLGRKQPQRVERLVDQCRGRLLVRHRARLLAAPVA